MFIIPNVMFPVCSVSQKTAVANSNLAESVFHFLNWSKPSKSVTYRLSVMGNEGNLLSHSICCILERHRLKSHVATQLCTRVSWLRCSADCASLHAQYHLAVKRDVYIFVSLQLCYEFQDGQKSQQEKRKKWLLINDAGPWKHFAKWKKSGRKDVMWHGIYWTCSHAEK